MQVDIFDVEHGACAVVRCPNGNIVMIDTGHNASSGWYPSHHFPQIELLIITNMDEDHVSGLSGLFSLSNIKAILTNPTIDATALAVLKNEGGMGTGIRQLHGWLASPSVAPIVQPDLSGVEIAYFYNHYPLFADTNNLSLAAFVKFNGFSILFPGDLEKAGWESLLLLESFRNELVHVKVLVASHHGRLNGYHEDIFRYFSPDLVVLSDHSIQYSTQDTVRLYKTRANGLLWSNGQNRHVLTTRSDGRITFRVEAYLYTVHAG